MNDKQDAYRTFQLMNYLEAGDTVSQRELAGRLGIAVGLVNSCLKNFVAKGYVRVKAFPRNRYAYLLTPKGFAEKSRLAYQHLNYFTSLYTTTRQEYLDLFRRLKAQGVSEVAFCGVNEVAEIAYLSLQEAGVSLQLVMDDVAAGKRFFAFSVTTLADGVRGDCREIIISSMKKRDQLNASLLQLGIAVERIHGGGGIR